MIIAGITIEKKEVFMIQKIKDFFTPGDYIVPEAIRARASKFYVVAAISFAFGICGSVFGGTAKGMIYGIALAIAFAVTGRISYLRVTKKGYRTIRCKCVNLAYMNDKVASVAVPLKFAKKNDDDGKRVITDFVFMEEPEKGSEDNEDENKLRNVFKPPFLVPYDDRFSGVRIGTVVNIYTTANGNIFEFRGTRRIDPIIGAEILYTEQETENLE